MGSNFFGRKIPQTKSINEIVVKVLNYEISDAKELLDALLKETEIHIGKSSFGCKFIFNANGMKFNSINEFKDFLKDFKITSEYGENYSFEEFWEMVDDKKDVRGFYNDYTNFNSLEGYIFSKSTNFC